jgi:hypothetical protein
MGKCVSTPARRPTVLCGPEAVETDSLRGKPLPTLTFHALLANVILRPCPYVPLLPSRKQPRPPSACSASSSPSSPGVLRVGRRR